MIGGRGEIKYDVKFKACRLIALSLFVVLLAATPVRAEHGDYLLGTLGYWGDSSQRRESIIRTSSPTITRRATLFSKTTTSPDADQYSTGFVEH